jgi:hypothetical protein
MVSDKIERTKDVRIFLDDLVEVYLKHGMSLAHEDSQGAFIVDKFTIENVKWLMEAYDNIHSEDKWLPELIKKE